jgi:hypothetical protein
MTDLILALYLTDEQTKLLVRIFYLWNLQSPV